MTKGQLRELLNCLDDSRACVSGRCDELLSPVTEAIDACYSLIETEIAKRDRAEDRRPASDPAEAMGGLVPGNR